MHPENYEGARIIFDLIRRNENVTADVKKNLQDTYGLGEQTVQDIVDELKEDYNATNAKYMRAEKLIRALLLFEDFDDYDTATTDLTTIMVCNAFILGYEQCKRDVIEDIKKSTKK